MGRREAGRGIWLAAFGVVARRRACARVYMRADGIHGPVGYDVIWTDYVGFNVNVL